MHAEPMTSFPCLANICIKMSVKKKKKVAAYVTRQSSIKRKQIKDELIASSKEARGVTSERRYLLGRRILLMA